ncbi:50S ribosomal protein L31 [Candidatus Uhrbacteria bacterium]|jgi:large subunit ribosomal protein L31|nr:50S ribosomal protein L31 [Candidatus Uhrbacteria bacterium]
MKKEIHPEYFTDSKISCACGEKVTIGSTLKEISIELCHKCHPFYTGKQKIIDTARRVEKFQTRLTKKSEAITGKKEKHAKRDAEKKAKREEAEKAA